MTDQGPSADTDVLADAVSAPEAPTSDVRPAQPIREVWPPRLRSGVLLLGSGVVALIGVYAALVDQVTAFAAVQSADWLFSFELARVVLDFGTLRGQDIPAAPYYFPDLAVLVILRVFTDNLTLQLAVYFLLFCAAFSLIVFGLLRRTGVQRWHAIVGASLAVVLFGLMPQLDIGPPSPYFLKNFPGSHITTAVVALGGLLVYLQTRGLRIGWGLSVLVFMLAVLCYRSDSILAVYLTCPLLAVMCLDAVLRAVNRRTLAVFIATISIPPIIERETRAWQDRILGVTGTIAVPGQIPGSLDAVQANAAQFVSALDLAARGQPLLYIQLAALNVFMLASLVWIVVTAQRRSERMQGSLADLVRIIMFLELSQTVVLAASVALNVVTIPDLFRYLIPCFAFPIVGAYIVALNVLARTRGRTARQIAEAAILVLASGLPVLNLNVLRTTSGPRLSTLSLDPPYPAWVRCVDQVSAQYGLHDGLATYWDTRPLRMFNRSSIGVTQIDSRLNFSLLADNEHFLFDASGAVRPFDFVLADGIHHEIDAGQVISAVGAPAAIASCPANGLTLNTATGLDYKVLVYPSGVDQQRLEQFAAPRVEAFERTRLHLYTLGTPIRFTRDGNAASYVGSGWQLPESGGTWTLGSQSTLLIAPDMARRSGDLRLSVRAGALVSAAFPERNVSVLVRGTKIADWSFTLGAPPQTHTAIIAASLWQQDGIVEIAFQMEPPMVEEVTGVKGDRRRLGIAVEYAQLDQVPGASLSPSPRQEPSA